MVIMMGAEHSTDTKVTGRKIVPRKAIVFIMDPSRLVLIAICLISPDSWILILLSS